MLDMVFNHTSTEHKWFKKGFSWREKTFKTSTFLRREKREILLLTGLQNLGEMLGNM